MTDASEHLTTDRKKLHYWRGELMRRATIDEMAQATPRERIHVPGDDLLDIWQHNDHAYAIDKFGNFWTSAPLDTPTRTRRIYMDTDDARIRDDETALILSDQTRRGLLQLLGAQSRDMMRHASLTDEEIMSVEAFRHLLLK